MKVAEKIKENKIFFITFALLLILSLYYIFTKGFNALVNNYYGVLYVANYSCGYSSRLLIGAIFSLFIKDKLDIILLTKILLVIYFLCCFCISVFVNNRLKKTNYEGLALYVVVMILSPVFIGLLGYLGTTDLFWILLALGCFAVINNKYLRWLVPVFCAVAIAIHEVFATTYMPVIALAILYQFAKKPTVGNFAYVAVSALIMGAATVYFMFIGDATMKMTSDEMVAYTESRLELHGEPFSDYYLRSIFFWEVHEVDNYSGFFGYLKYNLDRYALEDPGKFKDAIVFNCMNIIASIPFVSMMVRSFRAEKNYLKKFIFIASLLIIPVTLITIFLSTDSERYSMHLFLPIILFLLFFVKEKDISFLEGYNSIISLFNEHRIAFTLVCISIIKIVISGVRY